MSWWTTGGFSSWRYATPLVTSEHYEVRSWVIHVIYTAPLPGHRSAFKHNSIMMCNSIPLIILLLLLKCVVIYQAKASFSNYIACIEVVCGCNQFFPTEGHCIKALFIRCNLCIDKFISPQTECSSATELGTTITDEQFSLDNSSCSSIINYKRFT